MINDPYHYKSKFVISVLAIFAALLIYGYVTSQPMIIVVNEQKTFNDAIFSNDVSSCDAFDGTIKNNCIYVIVSRQAVEQNNPSLCNTYQAVKQQCTEYYENSIAVNSSSCETVQNKDSCYIQMAISHSDSALCANIQDETIKTNCIGVTSDR